ncbi:MAG: AGE family epimerase/isomerase, partial [Pseudomonadota bacterium]|nr:AGE family epimerase/isomerase [Pseudomonadota bacterium]
MAESELKSAYQAFRAWMFDEALPFWATTRDGPGLGFVEHLTLQGAPDPVSFKRMRLQARQIYVFSHAEILGWPGGREIARAGFDFIRQHGWREAGGWARRLGREGGVEDATADLYDNATVLFGLAWYARAAGDPEATEWANRTVTWVRQAMAAPHGGFWNTLPPGAEPRQQNPH